MNLKFNSLLKQSIYLIMIITMTSCAKIPVLFKTSESSKEQNETVLNQFFKAKDPILQPGDKITMSIWGHDDLSIGSVNSIYSSSEETGKWITLDKDGEANLPKIGRIKLSGYNLKEVNYFLEQKYSSQLKDPIINVRVLNHYVTVLGEVNKPGKYQLDNEKITLVQIIGTAQGFNNYANSRVKLVRIVNNAPVELLIDYTQLVSLADYNVVLQPDDVIYVEPNKNKSSDDLLKRATPIAGIVTAVAVLMSIFLK